MNEGQSMLTAVFPNVIDIAMMVVTVLAFIGTWGVRRFNRRLHEDNAARRKALHRHS